MAKSYDENKCLRSVSRVARIDYGTNSIQAGKTAIIGIHTWGKIDYLVNYCGWRFYWNNSAGTGGYIGSSDDSYKKKTYREMKKASKAPKLTNKNKRK